MKLKHLAMSALASAMLFSSTLLPAFTQHNFLLDAPPKKEIQADATILLSVRDIDSDASMVYACAPLVNMNKE